MHHTVARTQHRRAAFSTWQEGARLWHTVLRAVPGVVALCIMPDHIHVLAPRDVRAPLGRALGGYTRWRNARRRQEGALWQPLPQPTAVEGPKKLRRNVRYIHLNPCRAGLVRDPLAWPLSTHLDAVGLVARPVRRRVTDPHAFHRYVSGDPTVDPLGTDLPAAQGATPTPDAVLDAVSLVLRTPVAHLRQRGPARTTALHALRTLTPCSRREIGERLHLCERGISRARIATDDTIRLIDRWSGDPRCTPLCPSTLGSLLQGSRYHGLRD